MTTSRHSGRARAGLLAVVAFGTLALGGCRGGVAAQPSPPAAAVEESGARELAGVEEGLDRMELEIDADGAG